MTSTIIEFPNATSTAAPTTHGKRRRRGPYKSRTLKVPTVERDFIEERVTAYSDLEPHICDVVKMGRIAVQLHKGDDRELFDFIVFELWEKLEDLRKRYYAKGFA